MKKKNLLLLLCISCLCLLIQSCDISSSKSKIVKFENLKGLKIDNIAIDDDGHIKEPTLQERNGWTFEGWYLDATFNNKIEDLSTYTFTKSTTVYAKWKLTRYTITYEGVSGVTNLENLPTEYVVKHTFPEDYSEEEIDDVWKADFDYSGKIPTFNEEKAIRGIELVDPVRPGYKFLGWYDSDGNKVDKLNNIEPTNITLTAKWEIGAFYNITYIVNGGILPEDAPKTFEGSIGTILKKAIFTNIDMVFVRWEDAEGNVYDRISPNTFKDITLIAIFEKRQSIQKWNINQINFQGKGMIYEIKVDSVEENDPYNSAYLGHQKELKQQWQAKVQAAYDIIIKYTAWGDEAPWGRGRVSYINKKYLDGFDDVYVTEINSTWIPRLVRGNSIVELYDMNTGDGIFKQLGSSQSNVGYVQNETINLATSVNNKIYGYNINKPTADYFMYYNVDKVKTLDLDDPAELWMKGEWTISNFKKWTKAAQSKLDKDNYVFDMDFGSAIIGLTTSTGGALTSINPSKLYLTNNEVIDNIKYLQEAYTNGLYFNRNAQEVSSGFMTGVTIFHSGEINYLKNNLRFDSRIINFKIGVVPYPTADGLGGTPITTTDVSKAIKLDNGEYLKDKDGNYIETVDMSESSFNVPFTNTSCYAVLNNENGKNGITSNIVMNILHDLLACYDFNYDCERDDCTFHYSVETKLDRDIDAMVIKSCQNNMYYEVLDTVSFSSTNNFNLAALSIVKNNEDPAASLNELLSKYQVIMNELGYSI